MNALAFASPKLVEAARSAAPYLRLIPRTPPLAHFPTHIVKVANAARVYPSTHREERALQAAEYFISRHPEARIGERVRFGLAYGFVTREFARAVRVAREQLSRSGDAQHRVLHSDSGETARSSGREVTLRNERLECCGSSGEKSAADAGSCATFSSGSPLGASSVKRVNGRDSSSATKERREALKRRVLAGTVSAQSSSEATGQVPPLEISPHSS